MYIVPDTYPSALEGSSKGSGAAHVAASPSGAPSPKGQLEDGGEGGLEGQNDSIEGVMNLAQGGAAKIGDQAQRAAPANASGADNHMQGSHQAGLHANAASDGNETSGGYRGASEGADVADGGGSDRTEGESRAGEAAEESDQVANVEPLAVMHSPECSESCLTETCSGHGACGGTPCHCICAHGFNGQYCEEKVPVVSNFRLRRPSKPCPDNCGGQGACMHNGTCSCDKGWAGYNCSLECAGGAANPCSGHGTCNMTDGKCLCDEGFAGRNCTRRSVPTDVNEYRANVLGRKENEQAPKQLTVEAALAALQEQVAEPSGQQAADKAKQASDKSVETAAGKGHNGTNASKVDAAVPEKPRPAGDKFVPGVVIDDKKLAAYGVNHASFDLGSKALASNKDAKGAASLLRTDRSVQERWKGAAPATRRFPARRGPDRSTLPRRPHDLYYTPRKQPGSH